ncbi:MAG TPA: cyclic nucleotide-binding domain-containing protein, partial [Candidatus Acidoferrum sp.]|nr:cyclic nucleotide-binding domain-containing protein [Candidatus Acidoferrum sp.]
MIANPSRNTAGEQTGSEGRPFRDLAGVPAKVVEYRTAETIFTQGEVSRTVIYIQKGGVTLSVVNETGKEAIVAVLGPGDFLGEGCVAGQSVRMETATAIKPTAVLVIDKNEMRRMLHAEHTLPGRFISYMLT